jgi:hypothetical protein
MISGEYGRQQGTGNDAADGITDTGNLKDNI